jgi:hypothetical protein
MAIFAGYGVAFYFHSISTIAQAVFSQRRSPSRGWLTVTLWSIGVAVVALALITGLITNEQRRNYAGYYHAINDVIFSDFHWLGQHTTHRQMVAMGEPSIAWAYSPVAGPGAAAFLAVSVPQINPQANRLREMLRAGEADVPWLQKSGISVFYTCLPRTFVCEDLENNDLFKVRRGVYLVPDSPDVR